MHAPAASAGFTQALEEDFPTRAYSHLNRYPESSLHLHLPVLIGKYVSNC